ncbi:MAG: hypothetical protein K0S00_3966 [Xanthobacteraceae bacterium]|jgi:hypothetical protein|nr:hypothetical protein [Xanthobacteraceae bacterium]
MNMRVQIEEPALKAKRDRAAQIHFDLEHPMRHLRRAAQLVAMSKEAWESGLGPDPAGTLGLALDFLIDSVEEVVETYLDEEDEAVTA